MNEALQPSWIAVDWGTTHMRAYAMDGSGVVLSSAAGAGMAALARGQDTDGFEASLVQAIGPWLGAASASNPMTVVMCGMVGSRQGWHEAGYLPVPQTLSRLGEMLTRVPVSDARLAPFIVPGISQTDPYDVMRGEETQLAGYAAQTRAEGDAAGSRVCLPGTHAKWARLHGATITYFSTAMTGELFDLVTTHSILAHSVDKEAMDAEAFSDAVRTAFHDPACLTEALFSVRAEDLLTGQDGARARGRVSGLLIGAELAGAKLVAGEPITLIGAPALCRAYSDALSALGFSAQLLDGEAMVLRGLGDVYAQLARRDAVVA